MHSNRKIAGSQSWAAGRHDRLAVLTASLFLLLLPDLQAVVSQC